MRRWTIAFPYLLFAAMAMLVVWSNMRGDQADGGSMPRAQDPSDRLIDPVCNMEVNPGWGFAFEYEGHTAYFCSLRCRDDFAANPETYLTERCLVCDAPIIGASAFRATYLKRTFFLCTGEHRDRFKADPAAYFMHRMWGIPDWMYYASIATVLIISFFMFEGVSSLRRPEPRRDLVAGRGGPAAITGVTLRTRPSLISRSLGIARSIISSWSPDSSGRVGIGGFAASSGAAPGTATLRLSDLNRIALPVQSSSAKPIVTGSARIELTSAAVVRALVQSRPLRFSAQAVTVLIFLIIIAAGLFGNQNPSLNIAPLLTWTIWWCGLVVLIMFAGKAWCYMCPWDAIAGWMERLRLWKKTDEGLGLGMKWPRVLRNVWLATFLFVGLTWVELGFGVTTRPIVTAYVAIAMLLGAIVCAFLFDRKSFCRYGCLVGRVSGLYAMFSGLEIRARDAQVCKTCKTKECVKGSDTAYGCPTFEYPGNMEVNTYCIQCTECLQACPHGNMAVNLRPWGSDLAAQGKPRSDEAYLALLMLAISGFHGLTMTPVWAELTGSIEAALPAGRIASFTLGMIGLMIAPILVYAVLVWLSYLIVVVSTGNGSRGALMSYRDYFIRYAYCVLPIALFYHLAHNLQHLLMEGPKVIALVSDPFGWGWNLFGTAPWRIPPIASLDVLWILQVILIGVGHVYSLWAAQKISRRIFDNEAAASRGQWPVLIGMIAFSVFSLWLLKQPMEMRTSSM